MSKVVKYKKGLVETKTGTAINTQQDAWWQDAKCGCGIDCCDGVIVLPDVESGVVSYLYIYDGALVTKTKADYEANGPAPE